MTQKVPPDGVCTKTVDRRAQKLVDNWTAAANKLKDQKPEIEWVRAEFKDRKGSETILGCRNFKQFCTLKLKKTEQAVYAMLGDYTAKASAKKGGKSGKPTTTSPLTAGEDSMERMREAIEAANAHFDLRDKGQIEEAQKMEQEYRSIAKAEAIQSPMFSVSQRGMMSDFIQANLDLYKQIENGLANGISIKQLQKHVEAMRKRFATILGKEKPKETAAPEPVKADSTKPLYFVEHKKDGTDTPYRVCSQNTTYGFYPTQEEAQKECDKLLDKAKGAKKEAAPVKASAATRKAS